MVCQPNYSTERFISCPASFVADDTMAIIRSSLSKLQDVIEQCYGNCSVRICEEKEEGQLRILPCLHVVCTMHLELALNSAREASRRVRAPTKYTDDRRFVCPVCEVPVYLHPALGLEEFPKTTPVKDLLVSQTPQAREFEEDIQLTDDKESRRYLLRNGDYYFHSEIGDHGMDHGCFTRISAILADDDGANAKDPKLFICDSSLNTITTMKLDGSVVHTNFTGESLRNICLRKDNGNIVGLVAEKDYCLVEWQQDGLRLRELCRENQYSQALDAEPFGIAVDSNHMFTISLLQHDRLFSFIEDIENPDESPRFGSSGLASCEFRGPYYLTRTSHGFIVVSDTLNHRVKIHDHRQGAMKVQFGRKGSKPGELFYPQGVCVDSENNIFVADSGNYRVQVFSDFGGYISSPVVETWNYGRADQDIKPTQVCVLKDGQLLVAMRGRGYNKIHIYRPRYGVFNETETKASRCSICCLTCCQGHGDYEPIN